MSFTFAGVGHFIHKDEVEDSATAEISRSQVCFYKNVLYS